MCTTSPPGTAGKSTSFNVTTLRLIEEVCVFVDAIARPGSAQAGQPTVDALGPAFPADVTSTTPAVSIRPKTSVYS